MYDRQKVVNLSWIGFFLMVLAFVGMRGCWNVGRIADALETPTTQRSTP